jgi:hypothetical protein
MFFCTQASLGSARLVAYEITVVDPVMLTEPLRQARAWLWRPEIQVQRYACEEEQRID